jgi:O-acetylhomoserine/O-acetylserine sulfhydrylase-like pyridoxal-dependent enzyme
MLVTYLLYVNLGNYTCVVNPTSAPLEERINALEESTAVVAVTSESSAVTITI